MRPRAFRNSSGVWTVRDKYCCHHICAVDVATEPAVPRLALLDQPQEVVQALCKALQHSLASLVRYLTPG